MRGSGISFQLGMQNAKGKANGSKTVDTPSLFRPPQAPFNEQE